MKELKNIQAMLVIWSNNLKQSQAQVEASKKELKEQGKIPDLEKLSLLKQQLYRDVKEGKDTTEIVKAIKAIRSDYEIDRPRNIRRHNKLVDSVIYTILFFLVLTVSHDALKNCHRTQSTFCNQNERFGRTIYQYFYGDRQP